MLATGICRSDLSFMDGKWPSPLPIVLGHEGAGVVEAVGEGVDESRIGEPVVLTFAPPCGRCRFCLEGRANLCLEAAACMDAGTMRDGTTRLHRGDERVHHLALVSSFADHAVVPANAAIPVTGELEPGLACLLGCGVTTGVMSVTRRANVRPGESVAVFGCGGVGLAAVLGAGLISAQPVIAVDPLPDKRAMALGLGATHAVDPAEGDPAEQIRAIVPGGVDHAFEAIGIADGRRPGLPVGARRRHDGADRAARDGRQGRLRRVRRDAVRAHDPGIEPGRREPGAARAGAGAAGRVGTAGAGVRWSPTGCRSTASTRRARSPHPAPAGGW